MTSCLFCDIAAGKRKADIIYGSDDVLAFRDISPQAPHHILVIPRKHIATLNDLQDHDTELMGKLLLAAKHITKEVGLSETGYRTVINCNRDAGQTVFHIHLHILGGRYLGWPPG